MSDPMLPAPMLSAVDLVPGQLVEIWDQETFQFRAHVEECAAHLEVVWVRESGMGHRRLVAVTQCQPLVTVAE